MVDSWLYLQMLDYAEKTSLGLCLEQKGGKKFRTFKAVLNGIKHFSFQDTKWLNRIECFHLTSLLA
jgi:hypothetical protein